MYLGIEIGGTKLQLGLGPGDGTLVALWRGTVDVAAGPEGIRRQIMAAVPELLAKGRMNRSQIAGVGIGFGGPVDDRTHTIIKSHQIEGWDDFPLADWITDLLGWQAVLGNDADVAGLAEALFGAGKGLSPIFYITIGSGIGGGLIINGELYRGSGRGAAEIGHLALDGIYFGPSGSAIHTTTTVEDCTSGWAIAREARERLKRGEGRDSLLSGTVRKKKGPLTAHDVGQAAEQGDQFAKEVLRLAWLYLAQAICVVITLLCPRRIIVGGGVSLMGEKVLFRPLRELVAENVFQPFANCYDIVPAALAEEVVVHGALALARRRLGGS
jgi:glucokinase